MNLIPQLTDAGREMILAAMTEDTIKFTRIALGDGEIAQEAQKGDLWYNTGAEKLNEYKETWANSDRVITCGTNAPENPEEDDLWYNTASQTLYGFTQGWDQSVTQPTAIGESAPSEPADGDIWVDTANSTIQSFNASEDAWEDLDVSFTYAAAAPTTPTNGALWLNMDDEVLYVFDFGWFASLIVFTYAAAAPTGNLEGDLWFDTAEGELKEYISGWEPSSLEFVYSTVEPSEANENSLWFNPDTSKLYIKTTTDWQEDSTRITCSTSEPESMYTLDSLIHQVMSCNITGIIRGKNYVGLTTEMTNADLETDFKWRETGVFAEDESGTEYLYAYCNAGDNYDSVNSNQTSRTIHSTLEILVAIGNAENISAEIGGGATYLTRAAFEEHLRDSNPHNVTAQDVGLGYVPNVATNDQTPTYGSATVNNLVSGEKVSNAFAKIAAAIKSYIAHLADSVSHITKSERSAWNSKADSGHKHSAADITSGILSISRGGTGSTSAAAARKALVLNEMFKQRYYQVEITFSANQEKNGDIVIDKIPGYRAVAVGEWQIFSINNSSRVSEIGVQRFFFGSSSAEDICSYKLCNRYNGNNSCVLDVGVLYIRET